MGICPAEVDEECPGNYTNTERKQSVVSNGMVIRYFQWLVPYTSWICFTIIMASPLIISFWDFCSWQDTPLKPCILSWPCTYTNYRHLTALCYVLSHFRHVIPAVHLSAVAITYWTGYKWHGLLIQWSDRRYQHYYPRCKWNCSCLLTTFPVQINLKPYWSWNLFCCLQQRSTFPSYKWNTNASGNKFYSYNCHR